MNYDAAIRELEAKRDHCIAAIAALKHLAGPDVTPAAPPAKRGRKPGSAYNPTMAAYQKKYREKKKAERAAAAERDASNNGSDSLNTAELVQAS